jgi:hypothetical protein
VLGPYVKLLYLMFVKYKHTTQSIWGEIEVRQRFINKIFAKESLI